jgi:acyl-CoA thioester hydrolase
MAAPYFTGGAGKLAELFLTYRGTVYPWQCDHAGHMNVMWYAGKFDEATWQLFAAIGVTPSFLRGQGMGVAALRQSTNYRRELRAGDVLSVRSGVLEMRSLRIRFYHEMVNDETGQIAATTEITGVLIDLSTRKPCPFTPEIVQQGRARVVAIPS